MPSLSFESLDEKLAERFHTTVAVLKQLNPGGLPAGAKGPKPVASPTPTATPTARPSSAPSGAGFVPQPGPASYFQAGQQIRVGELRVTARRVSRKRVEEVLIERASEGEVAE